MGHLGWHLKKPILKIQPLKCHWNTTNQLAFWHSSPLRLLHFEKLILRKVRCHFLKWGSFSNTANVHYCIQSISWQNILLLQNYVLCILIALLPSQCRRDSKEPCAHLHGSLFNPHEGLFFWCFHQFSR
jgi:hypothetical protein